MKFSSLSGVALSLPVNSNSTSGSIVGVSGLPSGSASSTARTSKTCGPGANSSAGISSSRLCGLRHSYQSSSLVLSSRHSNVSSAGAVWSSLPVNSNVVSLEPFAGVLVIVVSGSPTSTGGVTSHSYSTASASANSPSGSVAITRKMCSPTASPLYVTGGVQGTNGPMSSEHSNVASAMLAAKSNVANVSSVSPPLAGSPSGPGSNAGPAKIVVTMPVIVQWWTAGVGSTRPSLSTARTWNVCGPAWWSSNSCS